MDANGRELRVRWSMVVQVAGWVTAALLTYAAINTRVTVMESRMNRLEGDVSEIKTDVKTLLQRKP